MLLALVISILLLPLILIIVLLIKITSSGRVLFWSERVGRYNKNFMMPKFRSMRANTPNVATHLLDNADSFLTPIGKFLRKYSLDELPQLWCILEGKMSFVGPRPALFNQYDLIVLRTEKNIHHLKPGITGLAQIKGRDDISIPEKVSLDLKYKQQQSFWLDIKILVQTFTTVVKSQNISH